jgi:hypothetical protein
MTEIGIDTIVSADRDYARLALTQSRVGELRTEIGQLAAAAEAVRSRVDFDAEPADFVRAIADTAIGHRNA